MFYLPIKYPCPYNKGSYFAFWLFGGVLAVEQDINHSLCLLPIYNQFVCVCVGEGAVEIRGGGLFSGTDYCISILFNSLIAYSQDLIHIIVISYHIPFMISLVLISRQYTNCKLITIIIYYQVSQILFNMM